MKDVRPGESLWSEWIGYGYEETAPECSAVYFTVGHLDIGVEIVRRALASAIQRDGVVDSLSDGFSAILNGTVVHSWAGYVDGDREMTICDPYGITDLGDEVEELSISAITLVEI